MIPHTILDIVLTLAVCGTVAIALVADLAILAAWVRGRWR
jgi:hypothetical protein